MPAISGYRGKVEIDGKMFRANRWSVEYALETDDGTSSYGVPTDPFDNAPTSGKHKLPTKTFYPKYVEISATIEAYYDTVHGFMSNTGIKDGNTNPTNVLVVPGRKVALKLYPAKDIPNSVTTTKNTACWEFAEFLILNVSHSVEVRGIQRFTISGKNNSKDYKFDNI